MPGVTAEGFERKPLGTIEQEIKDFIHATIRADANLGGDSLWGNFISIVASKQSEIWEILEELYRIIDPDNATGAALDILCALSGVIRLRATRSTVPLTVNLDAGTSLLIGRVVSLSSDPTRTFITTTTVTNDTADAGNFQVEAQAENTGPVAAPSGTIDTIDTPVAGWNSVSNGDAPAAVTAGNTETYALGDTQTLLVDVDGVSDTATFAIGTPASVNGNNEPFALTDGWTLQVAVDGGSPQTAIFNTGDFANIALATALEVAAVVTADIVGGNGTDVASSINVNSNTLGPDSSIEILGGTARAALGLALGTATGGGDFADIANATAAEVVAVLEADLGGTTCTVEAGAPKITSDDPGTGGSIEVTGGTANGALGFGTVEVLGYDGEAAVLGTDTETDEDLRVRREVLLATPGSATLDAIRAQVLGVTGVTSCSAFENTTLVVDGDGVPGKEFEVLVVGGDGDDIAQAIWDSKGGGIGAHGDLTGNAVDAAGGAQTLDYSRPTDTPIYVDFTVTTDGDYPVDGDAQVKAAIKVYGDTLVVGADVIWELAKSKVFGVSGVLDVTLFEIGTAPAPAGTSNIVIGSRAQASWDVTDMTVI